MADRAAKAASEWEQFGRQEPYFGVLANARFRRAQLDDATLDEFFASGYLQIAAMLDMAEAHAGRPLELSRALDFGCGVGRLAIALAQRADEAVGVDVSPSMLAEARRNCDARGVDNVTLVETRALSSLQERFDLITSHIVFQHIPSTTGYELLGRLADLLAPGGVAVMQFTLSPVSPLARPFYAILRSVPPARRIWNLVRGRRADFPFMEMNVYSLERLLAVLERSGINDATVRFEAAERKADFNQAVLIFGRPLAAA